MTERRYVVTSTFRDWDGLTVREGAEADELVQTGFNGKGTPFYNLIADDRVIAVTLNRPPCRLISRSLIHQPQ